MKYILIMLIFFLSSCGIVETQRQQDNTTKQVKNMETKKDINENQEVPTISEPITMKEKIEESICLVFDDFTDISKNNWIMVNDGVMGGKSIGKYDIQNSVFTLSGSINTNGGGFSSVRTGLNKGILSEYNAIKIIAKADKRRYQITFRDNNRRGISHRAILPFEADNEFEEIKININDLEPVYFGRKVNADSFDKDNAREIGFIISDGIDGKFTLEIESIELCK